MAQQLLENVAKGIANPKYYVKEDILYYKDILYVPRKLDFRLKTSPSVAQQSYWGSLGF